MDLSRTLSSLAGRILRPFHAGRDKLAAGKQPGAAALTVGSDAFRDGGRIPDAYTGLDGRSPPLHWSPPPAGTQEVVVLIEDPDAPLPQPFVHWIVYGIAPAITSLPEGLPPTSAPLANGARQGETSLYKEGYVGPTPPPGHGVHHYHVEVFALDRRLEVDAPVDRDDLVEAMRGHVLASGELVGTYER